MKNASEREVQGKNNSIKALGLEKKSCSKKMRHNDAMTSYEILSIEPTSVGKYWVITYTTGPGKTDKEMVEALDSHEASIVFRNLMMKQAKLAAAHHSKK